jgi:hypothetical protein
MKYEENPEDRKQSRRTNFNHKKHTVKEKFIEQRDQIKIKKEFKHKIEQMKEEELWEEWDNEIH